MSRGKWGKGVGLVLTISFSGEPETAPHIPQCFLLRKVWRNSRQWGSFMTSTRTDARPVALVPSITSPRKAK